MNGARDSMYDHLQHLTDRRGLFEHADGTEPRLEHGYCTDDNARLLVVTGRDPDSSVARGLGRSALEFVLGAQDIDGRCRNRMDLTGEWTDAATTQDCWGRGLWALGETAVAHHDPSVRRRALRAFERGARRRSPWSRSMAFAALGASAVLQHDPDDLVARTLLIDALRLIGPVPAGNWAWPEPRLRYANAMLAEAVIAAGAALDRPADVDRGLAMLAWLLQLETANGHLSVTGTDGRGPGDVGPQFDQQPIEVAAMADACWRAHGLTGDALWSRGVKAAAGWFTGDNDAGLSMIDDVSGGGFDGLHADRVNLNQGAESTLALVSTMQRARSFAAAA